MISDLSLGNITMRMILLFVSFDSFILFDFFQLILFVLVLRLLCFSTNYAFILLIYVVLLNLIGFFVCFVAFLTCFNLIFNMILLSCPQIHMLKVKAMFLYVFFAQINFAVVKNCSNS